MPCSSNHRPIITQGRSVGRFAGSVNLFAPTRGCARIARFNPGLLATAHYRGLFNSARGSTARRLHLCEA